MHVAIPWTGDCLHRRSALAWVARHWVGIGCAPTLGVPDGADWVKAQAVRNATGDTDADVLVVADADVWGDGVAEAIQRVRDGAPWVIPHLRVHRLDQEATARVLSGEQPGPSLPLDDFMDDLPGFPYTGIEGGGIVVLRRDVYEDCPLDPRFVGWGQEDESWGIALRCLYGPPVRITEPLWHLWHPPQPRLTRGTGSEASQALFKRYARVRRHPDRMRALIAEAR